MGREGGCIMGAGPDMDPLALFARAAPAFPVDLRDEEESAPDARFLGSQSMSALGMREALVVTYLFLITSVFKASGLVTPWSF